jgi:hypothetical protein
MQEQKSPTTTDMTNTYIREHPDIKSCLRKNLINYSSLSRLIAKDLSIEKKTSKEAILIAARRFREKLVKENVLEVKIKELLKKSELDVKNKMVVLVLERGSNLKSIDYIQSLIRKEFGTFYLLEGSNNYTIIMQEKYMHLIDKHFKYELIKRNSDLVLITIKSSSEIETTKGVVSYLTALFAENDVNILEFLSCWTDTLFVIESKDVTKALTFLKF